MRSPNYDNRTKPISVLVMHYTGMKTGAAALDRLCESAAKVSAHYCIEEDGTLHKLVEESHRAWHAGLGCWQGETDVNNISIGIELVNKGHKYGYTTFPDEQINQLIDLSQRIIEKYAINPDNIIGHSDLAPDRKEDPGELFPWKHLAQQGIGLYPGIHSVSEKQQVLEECNNIIAENNYNVTELMQYNKLFFLLKKYGYSIESKEKTLIAYMRHFVPAYFISHAS